MGARQQPAGDRPEISKEQILDELDASIEGWENGYREVDGVIRDPGALYSIACLREARAIVSASDRK